ncbi:MAG: hypothetical protein EBZ05_08410, partial [Verrucomicrobia bacterium]|nr:hypothetical protein [Verrucomicrobiota bacterium]
FLFLGFTLFLAANSFAQNLVKNGNFSSGNTGFTTSYTYSTGNSTNSSVFSEGKYWVGSQASLVHPDFSSAYDHTSTNSSGKFFIANGGPDTTQTIWQSDVIFVSQYNMTFRFEAWVTSLVSLSSLAPPKLYFEIGNGTSWTPLGGEVSLTSGISPGTWVLKYTDGILSLPGNYYLRLRNNQSAAAGNDFGLDDIYFGLRTGSPSYASDQGSATPPTYSPVAVNTPSNLSFYNVQTNGVSLSWSAPQGTAPSDYSVQYSANDGATWSVFNDGVSTATFATVTGLAPYTSYLFRVAAVSGGITGVYSGPVEVTTKNRPPTNFQVSAVGANTATFTWTAPSQPNPPGGYLLGISWGNSDGTSFGLSYPIPAGRTSVTLNESSLYTGTTYTNVNLYSMGTASEDSSVMSDRTTTGNFTTKSGNAGTFETWTTPRGATNIAFTLTGAQGGRGANDGNSGAIGGPGGRVTGTVTATNGQVFIILLGAVGGNGASASGSGGGASGMVPFHPAIYNYEDSFNGGLGGD